MGLVCLAHCRVVCHRTKATITAISDIMVDNTMGKPPVSSNPMPTVSSRKEEVWVTDFPSCTSHLVHQLQSKTCGTGHSFDNWYHFARHFLECGKNYVISMNIQA